MRFPGTARPGGRLCSSFYRAGLRSHPTKEASIHEKEAVRKLPGIRAQRTPETEFSEDETGIVTLTKEWTGFYNRIAQRFFHRPRVSHIDLDGYGSFIWKLIDGKRTVYDISRKLDEAYPGMEESLPRLIKFLEILRDHHFIVWKNAGEKTK